MKVNGLYVTAVTITVMFNDVDGKPFVPSMDAEDRLLSIPEVTAVGASGACGYYAEVVMGSIAEVKDESYHKVFKRIEEEIRKAKEDNV